MQIVNGIAPVIFVMPAKTGEAHTDIVPWDLWESEIAVKREGAADPSGKSWDTYQWL